MKKFFGLFFISILVLCVNLQIASAAATPTPTFRYNLTWDIRNIYYYTDSAAQSNYGTPISNASHNWCYTGYGNSLYPATRTTNQSNAAIDFHTYSKADGNNAKTELRIFGSTTPQIANDNDWDWGRIMINDYEIGNDSSYIQGVVAHEMGHVFGLDHNDTNPNSIMCSAWAGRAVNTVQKVDNDAFNLKHP
ncbi:matrixin family metalloprotease [Bacillus sp. RG28]|uniref:Matrixin family metalloprotease n=1 Tax=Gottfriedia endophytica TaxID=2820819 RepID=A0A940SHY9_9BACI|nr:matrixin family metalloprotease [Gottfriedia endophytica]MBP0726707.1 matrixin family metalloprotease [Gottfriedia endophytica]